MPVGTMEPPGALREEQRRKQEDKRLRDQKYLQGLLKENQELVKQRRGQPAQKPTPKSGAQQAPATTPAEPIIPGGISRGFNKRVLPRSGQPGYEEWRGKLEEAMAFHAAQRAKRKGIVSPQEQVAVADQKFRTSPKGAGVAAKGAGNIALQELKGTQATATATTATAAATELTELKAKLAAQEKELARRDMAEQARLSREATGANVATTVAGRGEVAGKQITSREKIAKIGAEVTARQAQTKLRKGEAAAAQKQSDAEADVEIKEKERKLGVAEKEMDFQRKRSVSPIKEGESDFAANNRTLAEKEYELKKTEVETLRKELDGLRRKKVAPLASPQVDRVAEIGATTQPAGGVAGGAETAMGGQPIPLPPDPAEWVPGTTYVSPQGIVGVWDGAEFKIIEGA